MRLSLDPRARRLLRRVPHTTAYTALELLLLSLLAIQCARLLWTLVTPVNPVGDWRPASAMRAPPAVSSSLLSTFDPFFRLEAQGPAMVTSLNLKLFGVREDRATGRGSAIIATPEGIQRSFAVGEEIMPGVTLAAVAFDSVTIDRGGTQEQLFLDQSTSATNVAPPGSPDFGASNQPPPSSGPRDPRMGPPAPPPPPAAAAPSPAPPALTSQIQAQPRLRGTLVTGVEVNPQGGGEAFRAAGLQPGDVVVAVNGERIRSVDQARGLAGRVGSGPVTLQVERGGQTVPLTVNNPQ
jgi:general secretion pathway protein C